MNNTLTAEEKEKLDELKKCFKFICNKYSLLIEFHESTCLYKESIRPTYNKFLNNQLLHRISTPESILKPVIRHIPMDDINEYIDSLKKDSVSVDINEVQELSRFDNEYSDQKLMYGVFNTGKNHSYVEYVSDKKSFNKLFYSGDLMEVLSEFSYIINKDTSKDQIILRYLETLKGKLCDPYDLIVTQVLNREPFIEIEYFSEPLPQFDSLSELKLKLDLNDVTLKRTRFSNY